MLIDLRMVRGTLHGIARYALELARRLPALAPDWSFVGLTGPAGLPNNLGPLAPELPLERCSAGFLSPLEQPALAAALVRTGCDLFHATSFSLPALWPGRLVATLHDANHLALRELYGPSRVAYYRLVVGPRARRAAALITVSEFSRDELARHLDLNPHKLRVIPLGVDERFRPPTEGEVHGFSRKHHLPPRYFAVVGNAKPHKSLKLVAQIASSLPAPVALLAGRGASRSLGFPEITLELDELPETELPAFYGGALGLLLPSRYEGFGLPALEAMACGCPVLAAHAGALPEVVGSAGVLLPPTDPQPWRDEALRLVRDDAHRRDLREKGLDRARRFTWDDCARRTLAVYRQALE